MLREFGLHLARQLGGPVLADVDAAVRRRRRLGGGAAPEAAPPESTTWLFMKTAVETMAVQQVRGR